MINSLKMKGISFSFLKNGYLMSFSLRFLWSLLYIKTFNNFMLLFCIEESDALKHKVAFFHRIRAD